MVKKQKYEAYAVATQTVAKTRQIVMLYDGAIRFLQQAKEAIRARRIEERYHLVTKASKIIFGLQSCLDFEKGGDVARTLFVFYASIGNRLFSIHRTNSLETCDEVIADLKQMRDAWHEVDQSMEGAATAPSEPTPAPSPVSDDGESVTLSA